MAGPTSISGLFSSATAGMRLLDGSDLLTLINLSGSGQSGLTALVGGGATGAPVVKNYINEFTTVGNVNDSCMLPPAIAGQEVTIINSGAQSLRVFAQPSNPGNVGAAADTIIALAGGAAAFVNIAANALQVFSCPSVGRWKCQF